MGIDVCKEISSPRISFSHDLNSQETVAATTTMTDYGLKKQDCINQRIDAFLLDSDFDFKNNHLVQEILLSSADELFSDGKILPTQIKKLNKSNIPQRPNAPSVPLQKTVVTEKKQLKELLSTNNDDDSDHDQKPTTMSKYFWQFKRSYSFNGDVTTKNKGLIRSSLQFFARSNSTGSTPNEQSKQAENQNQKPLSLQKQKSLPGRQISGSVSGSGLQKQKSLPSRSRPASTSAFHCYTNSNNNTTMKHPAPSLRKSGSYGSGVRISPALNIPDPYISRATLNLFGFGSLFCNGKIKRKKR